MAQIILALDQSSKVSGWSVFVDGSLTNYGKFEFADSDIAIRLNKIRSKTKDLLQEYGANILVLEDIQLQPNVMNNVQTFKVLAQVQGVLMELGVEIGIPTYIVPSVTWKSKLGVKGKGRQEQKKNAQLFVENTYGAKVSSDTADAICIGTFKSKDLSNQQSWD